MDRRTAGLELKRLLEQHQQQESTTLAALPEDAPAAELFAAIESASRLQIDGLVLTVKRRRSLDACPVPGCRFAPRRQACPHSNTRFELQHPPTGQTATGHGLLWHLLADHEPLAANLETEHSLLALLALLPTEPPSPRPEPGGT